MAIAHRVIDEVWRDTQEQPGMGPQLRVWEDDGGPVPPAIVDWLDTVRVWNHPLSKPAERWLDLQFLYSLRREFPESPYFKEYDVE